MRTALHTTSTLSLLAMALAFCATAAVAQPKDDVVHPHHPTDCSNCWVDEGMQDLTPAEQLQVMEDLYGLDGENTKNLTPEEIAQLYADLGGEGNEDDGDTGGKKHKAPKVDRNGRADHNGNSDHNSGGNGGGHSGGGRNADGSPK